MRKHISLLQTLISLLQTHPSLLGKMPGSLEQHRIPRQHAQHSIGLVCHATMHIGNIADGRISISEKKNDLIPGSEVEIWNGKTVCIWA